MAEKKAIEAFQRDMRKGTTNGQRRNARVYQRTGGDEWYWRKQNEKHEDLLDAEPIGPFPSAVDAGRDARHWIVYGTRFEE